MSENIILENDMTVLTFLSNQFLLLSNCIFVYMIIINLETFKKKTSFLLDDTKKEKELKSTCFRNRKCKKKRGRMIKNPRAGANTFLKKGKQYITQR